MGSVVEVYCDGCGEVIPDSGLIHAVQINAISSNGQPVQMVLCTQTEFILPEPEVRGGPKPGKITGCARKVLTKAVLERLYADVVEYTGDETAKPFTL